MSTATEIKLRGGTTSEHSTFTGAEREVTVDTDKETLVVHDGSTAGGFPLARMTDSTQTVTVDEIVAATVDATTVEATTVEATTVDLGDWTITQDGTSLKFAYQGTDRLSLSSAGALVAEDNVTAYGSA